MTAEPSNLVTDFLKSHRLGVLATGRRDGSPQQAIIAFNFSGTDIAISTGADSAKAKNTRRLARVSLAVVDGPRAVVVYGQARVLRGEEAAAYDERLDRSRLAQPGDAAPARPQRQQQGERVVLLVTPERYLANRLE